MKPGFALSCRVPVARHARVAPRAGFTLVEFLVVCAILGLLLALMLPAFQASREAARAMQCRQRLQQWALAIHNHEAAFGTLPSDGWGWRWVGEPDRGVGTEQPGGWIYQLLPQVDRRDLREMGAGLEELERRCALGDLVALPLSVARCPSRPAPELASGFQYFNAEERDSIGRTDYAMNAGDIFYEDPPGPRSLAEGDDSNFGWPDTSGVSGVGFLRSEIRWRDVARGLSNTFLVGEKRVSTEHYATRGDPGYDQSPFTGSDVDTHRWTEFPPDHDSVVIDRTRFGSAHPQAFHMAHCDGSVRSVSFRVDAILFRQQGNRRKENFSETP